MSAFVGRMFFEKGSHVWQATPETWVRIAEVFSISGLGETNDLADATTFASGGTYEYIAGLSDGANVNIECNYERQSAALQALIDAVKNKTTLVLRILVGNAGDTDKEDYQFQGVAIGWTINPAVSERNTISFQFKITGSVVYGEVA